MPPREAVARGTVPSNLNEAFQIGARAASTHEGLLVHCQHRHVQQRAWVAVRHLHRVMLELNRRRSDVKTWTCKQTTIAGPTCFIYLPRCSQHLEVNETCQSADRITSQIPQ